MESREKGPFFCQVEQIFLPSFFEIILMIFFSILIFSIFFFFFVVVNKYIYSSVALDF